MKFDYLIEYLSTGTRNNGAIRFENQQGTLEAESERAALAEACKKASQSARVFVCPAGADEASSYTIIER